MKRGTNNCATSPDLCKFWPVLAGVVVSGASGVFLSGRKLEKRFNVTIHLSTMMCAVVYVPCVPCSGG